MKKIYFLILGVVMGLSLFDGCTYFMLSNANRYYNVFFKFSIQIPNDWNKVEDQMGTVVAAICPLETKLDTFHENFNVTVGPLPNNVDLDTYFRKTMKLFAEKAFNFNLYGNGQKKIHGQKALWAMYSYELNGIHIETLQYMFSQNNNTYIITCVGERNKFDQYERTFRLIAHSFRFEKY